MYKRIAALLVTYNPVIEDLISNIYSYHLQFDKIVLIDNSTVESKQTEIKNLIFFFKNIFIHQFFENTGIAKAQNFGMAYLTSLNFDFVVEIDQDSSLPLNYVSKITKSYYKIAKHDGNKIAGIGPLPFDSLNNEVYDGHAINVGIKFVQYTLSSALLINLNTFNLIGPKDESLFIDLVDWEWCWRAKKYGYLTYIDTDLIFNHTMGNRHISFLFFRFGIPVPLRHYYSFRNSLLMMTKNYVPLKWKVINLVKLIFKLLSYPILLDQRLSRLKYMLYGIRDFMKNKIGKFNG